jgi:hypothetical protein
MRRLALVLAATAALGGCASFSMDSLAPQPVPVSIQLDSIPPGADAVTSAGPGCRTPCSVSVPANSGTLSVTFTQAKFQPMTVPVTITSVPGDFTTPAITNIDPNPVIAEMQPAVPARKARRVVKKRAAAPAPAAAAPAAASPFPAPR